MASLLVNADPHSLAPGHVAGEVVAIMEDGHVWGTSEVNRFIRISCPQATVADVSPLMQRGFDADGHFVPKRHLDLAALPTQAKNRLAALKAAFISARPTVKAAAKARVLAWIEAQLGRPLTAEEQARKTKEWLALIRSYWQQAKDSGNTALMAKLDKAYDRIIAESRDGRVVAEATAISGLQLPNEVNVTAAQLQSAVVVRDDVVVA